MRTLDGARSTLRHLVDQVCVRSLPESGPDPGFTPLIHVINDAGRAMVHGDASDWLDTMPALAALREALEEHYAPGVEKNPFDALGDDKSGIPYAAGALWATSAMFASALGELDYQAEHQRGRRQRELVRQVIVQLAQERGSVRHGLVAERLSKEGVEIDKSVISRALSDLIESGELEPATEQQHHDRRHRYYRLADPGDYAQQELRHRVVDSFREVLASDRDAAAGIAAELVHEVELQTTSGAPIPPARARRT